MKSNSRILFISQRKTFTNFVCSEFKNYDIANYQDIKDHNYDLPRICIQIESIHQIEILKYDIVIIDEIETVLNQFSSSTMVHPQLCYECMIDCINSSKTTIVADAFILQRSIDFITSLCDKKPLMIHNTKPFLKNRKAIQISQDCLDDDLINDMKNNKRIVYVSSSRTDLETLKRNIDEKQLTKSTLFYDRDSDKSDLYHVNRIWSKCDLVAFTSVIQTGISYMAKPFDICYANLQSTNLARDACQMLMRCRLLNDNIVKFSLNKRQIYNTTNINMFEDFSLFQINRYDM